MFYCEQRENLMRIYLNYLLQLGHGGADVLLYLRGEPHHALGPADLGEVLELGGAGQQLRLPHAVAQPGAQLQEALHAGAVVAAGAGHQAQQLLFKLGQVSADHNVIVHSENISLMTEVIRYVVDITLSQRGYLESRMGCQGQGQYESELVCRF